jgi:pSer/pThr/pTyr-binding forkhead associated (FHA) protein
MGAILLRLLVGMIAGVLGWAIWEPAYPKDANINSDSIEQTMILTIGALIGASIGALSGYMKGGRKHTLMGLGLGGLFGAIGITLGYSIGGISSALFGPAWWTWPFPMVVLPRTLALAPTALFLGLGVGAATLNKTRTIQGGIGGLLAGIASGLTFDLVGSMVGSLILSMRGQTSGETGTLSRGLTFLLIGGLIGLFIGIVERVSRSAWLRLTLGRNEGKEWVIDSNQTLIGRSEGVNVPIFGDPAIAPIHAVITRQGNQYLLIDQGAGTWLNGHPIQQAPLVPGSQIRIGNTTLDFLTKNVPAPVRGPESYPVAYPISSPQTQTPQSTGMSLYHGQPQPTMHPSIPPAGITTSYTLTALDGPLQGQRFTIQAAADLGRECPTIPMSFDTAASRRHAQVSPTPQGLNVVDLGSTNGVFLNGQRITTAVAPLGATIRIGSTQFRVDA